MDSLRFGDGRDWFFSTRLGLFMHFGLYSIEGWHEQDQMRRFIPRREYQELIHRFNPVRFDPDAILDLAEEAGMGYACLTAKHHDGFCLWDTECTDYNVMNSPYGKDIVGMYTDACHRRGFPLGIYYSVADWHHPNYPNQGRHHELPGPEQGDEPDFEEYLVFLRNQVRELCTNYGTVNHFFWDMNVPEHRDESVNRIIRRLQPNAVINDRGFDDGDFGTPEREHRSAETGEPLRYSRPTEACNSVGTQSWGYREDEDYYSARHLVESIDTILARGGNYLLNVGPDALGRVPEAAASILRQIGAWYAKTGEAFAGCEPASELTANRDVLLTRKGTTLYVHVARFPKSDSVVLNPIQVRPERAVLLNTGEPVETAVDLLPYLYLSGQEYLRLRHLPVSSLANEVMVVRLDFDRQLDEIAGESTEPFEG